METTCECPLLIQEAFNHQTELGWHLAIRGVFSNKAQVWYLYEQEDELPHYDRVLFDEPLEQILQQPWQSLQHWVVITLPTVCRSIREKDIRSFFQRRGRNRTLGGTEEPNGSHSTINTVV